MKAYLVAICIVMLMLLANLACGAEQAPLPPQAPLIVIDDTQRDDGVARALERLKAAKAKRLSCPTGCDCGCQEGLPCSCSSSRKKKTPSPAYYQAPAPLLQPQSQYAAPPRYNYAPQALFALSNRGSC
jgi:hypothetical protein